MKRGEAKKFRQAATYAAGLIPEEHADEHAEIFLPWMTGTAYTTGDKRRYAEHVYKCVQGHTSQADWTPDKTPALWVRCSEPGVEFPEWVQPTGAHDAYMTGDKVTYQEKHYISEVDNNIWQPGVYGWKEV